MNQFGNRESARLVVPRCGCPLLITATVAFAISVLASAEEDHASEPPGIPTQPSTASDSGATEVGSQEMRLPFDTYSIPKEQIDKKKIFWGDAEQFTKAGRFEYEELLMATPEYTTLKTEKVERGSGRYWILMSQASDRVVKALAHVGEETNYDLLCAEGYLKSLDPPRQSDDVTEIVIDTMVELAGD